MDLFIFMYLYFVGGGVWGTIAYSVKGNLLGAVVGAILTIIAHFIFRAIYQEGKKNSEQSRQGMIKSLYPE